MHEIILDLKFEFKKKQQKDRQKNCSPNVMIMMIIKPFQ